LAAIRSPLALYGLSALEVAKLLGCSKSKVLDALERRSVNKRPGYTLPTPEAARNRAKGNRKPYFGFCYFEGQISKHPIEYPILQLIHRRCQERVSIHYITLELNKRNMKSREGRSWSWAAVRNIVARFEQKKVVLTKGGEYEFR
jgi:hypothetical protein